MVKSLWLEKIRRIEKSLRLLKIRRIGNPCGQRNQADEGILAGVEIPVPGEKPAFVEKLVELEKQAGQEKQAACLLFRLGGISNC